MTQADSLLERKKINKWRRLTTGRIVRLGRLPYFVVLRRDIVGESPDREDNAPRAFTRHDTTAVYMTSTLKIG